MTFSFSNGVVIEVNGTGLTNVLDHVWNARLMLLEVNATADRMDQPVKEGVPFIESIEYKEPEDEDE